MSVRVLWLLFLLGVMKGAEINAATYVVDQRHYAASDANSGAPDKPWKTISKAAAVAKAGDVVQIKRGIYRESVTFKNAGRADAPITFEAAEPGVLVTGADAITGWKRAVDSKPIFFAPWKYRFQESSPHLAHPDDLYHRIIGRAEQVIIDGKLLQQVLALKDMRAGTFMADTRNARLYVWDAAGRDPGQISVQASTRARLWAVTGAHVVTRGINFRFCANTAQGGAVMTHGHHGVFQDCVMEQMHGPGASFVATNVLVENCIFRNNGQLGFTGNGSHNLRVSQCLIEGNNTKGFSRAWEAGGNKVVLSRNVVFEKSRFQFNHGFGIWFDIGNENAVVRNCLIATNEDAGIFYEISYGLHMHDNVIVGNGMAYTPGAWGAQSGISISSSPRSLIERNLIVGNLEGIAFREQGRVTPTIDSPGKEFPIWNHDETVRNNLIVRNTSFDFAGWFDVTDSRFLVRTGKAPISSTTVISRKKGTPRTAALPEGMRLDDLNFRLMDNVFTPTGATNRFSWGVPWRPFYASFHSLQEFRAAVPIDRGSVVDNVQFRAAQKMDFRLMPNASELVKRNYPRGQVPGVTLGY